VGTSSAQLVVSRPDTLVRGGLVFSGRVTTDEQNELTFGEIGSVLAVEAAKAGTQAYVVESGATESSLGRGIYRTWRVQGTTLEERVMLLPICAGTGSIVFMEVYGDGYARSVLDGWVGSFRWENGRNVKACDYLDPK
jgi:hypothetical protein